MKFNLLKPKPEPMVGSEPTGAMTVAPGQSSTPADNSTAVNKDMFGDIKNKFLNEMTKIPREWHVCVCVGVLLLLFVFEGSVHDRKIFGIGFFLLKM